MCFWLREFWKCLKRIEYYSFLILGMIFFGLFFRMVFFVVMIIILFVNFIRGFYIWDIVMMFNLLFVSFLSVFEILFIF